MLSGRSFLAQAVGLMVLFSTVANAGFYGRLELSVHQDHFLDRHSSLLEQQVDLGFVDQPRGLQAAANVRLQEGVDTSSQVQSLWVEQQLPGQDFSLQMGRFPHIDGLGFYQLDGIELKTGRQGVGWSLYAGIPARIEGYDDSVEADVLYGIDIAFTDLALPVEQSSGRISLQQLQAGQQQRRLGWDFAMRQSVKDKPYQNIELAFSGQCALALDHCSQWLASGTALLHQKHRLQVALESWTATDEVIGFREKFYASLVQGRQSALSVEWFYNRREREIWHGRVRRLQRETGTAGYEMTAAMTHRAFSGQSTLLQLDYRVLGDEAVFAGWVENSRAIGTHKRIRLSAAILHKQQGLYGYSRRSGMDILFEHALRSDLFLTLALSRWWDSRLANEYQVTLSLGYYFDYNPGQSSQESSDAR